MKNGKLATKNCCNWFSDFAVRRFINFSRKFIFAEIYFRGLANLNFLAETYFRESYDLKYFADINFREFGQNPRNPRKFVSAKISIPKVVDKSDNCDNL